VKVIGLSAGSVKFISTYDGHDLGAHLGALFGLNVDSVSHSGNRVFLVRPPQAAGSE
jgi:hypothetical protein